MTVEIANTEDGLGLNVRVCEDNMCLTGFCSSMHLVEKRLMSLDLLFAGRLQTPFAKYSS